MASAPFMDGGGLRVPEKEKGGSLLMAAQVQCAVIYALMMREMHTLYGKTKLGYLWAVVHSAFHVAVFWAVREFCRMQPPHGISILSYLVAGRILWDAITRTALKCMSAADSNKALLTFPQVTQLDVMFARATVLFATEIVSGALLLFLGWMLGVEFYLSDVGGLLFVLAVSFPMAMGLGMVLSALNQRLPVVERIVPIAFRFLFFMSGVFFAVTPFTGRIGEWILWNPILQLIEFTRTCISEGYPSEFVSPLYLVQIALYLFAAGLLLERYGRKGKG